MRISRRLGDERSREAIRLIEENKFGDAAIMLLQYYDKAYLRSVQQRDKKGVFVLELNEENPENAGKLVIQKAEEICRIITQ